MGEGIAILYHTAGKNLCFMKEDYCVVQTQCTMHDGWRKTSGSFDVSDFLFLIQVIG